MSKLKDEGGGHNVGSEYFENVDFPNQRVEQRPIEPLRKETCSWVAITGLVLGFIASQEIGTLPTALLDAIDSDLGPVSYYYWISAMGLTGSSVGWTLAGPLSDQYGRRNIVIAGNIISLIGAIIGACAKNIPVFLAGLLLAGLGTGGQAQAIAILSESFQNKYRGLVQGLLFISPFPFLATTPAIAASISAHTSWRWAFYINIILTTCSVILITISFYPPPRPRGRPEIWKQPISPEHLDFGTIILTLLFVAGFTLCLIWAGFGGYSWGSARILVPLIMGFTFIGLILPWSKYFASNALLPPALFSWRGFILVIVAAGFSAFSFASLNAIYPEEITALYTTDTMKAARYQFTSGFGSQLGIIAAGLAMRRIGHTHLVLAGLAAIVALFVGLMATLTPHSITPSLAYVTIGQFAGGCIKTIVFVGITFGAPDALIGSALCLMNLAWNFGPAFAIGFYLTIVRSRVGATLVSNVAKAVLPLGLPETSLPALLEAIAAGNEAGLMMIPGISLAVIEAATQATTQTYAAAFRIVYYVGMTAGILAIPAALCTKDFGPLMDDGIVVGAITERSAFSGKLEKSSVAQSGDA